jgi:hypothetical protein
MAVVDLASPVVAAPVVATHFIKLLLALSVNDVACTFFLYFYRYQVAARPWLICVSRFCFQGHQE